MTGHVRLPFRRNRRPSLHPIAEDEAYARLHGDRGEDIVRVERAPAPPPPEKRKVPEGLTGENLREAFERRLRSRHKHG
jgi:hypothetical protein